MGMGWIEKIVQAATSFWTCNSIWKQVLCKWYLSPQKEKRSHSSQKWLSLVFRKVEVKEGKMLSDLHNCYCNITVNLVLAFMVCASCSDYLEELTRENWEYTVNEMNKLIWRARANEQPSLIKCIDIWLPGHVVSAIEFGFWTEQIQNIKAGSCSNFTQ